MRKILPSTVINLQRSMFAQYCNFFLLRWHQVFFVSQKESTNVNISLHATSCKSLLSLEHYHTCCLCPLDYSLLPGKLLLIARYLLLFLPAIPSNTYMCYFMQYQLGNAASFKVAALGGLMLWKKRKPGCLFRHYISSPTNTESSSYYYMYAVCSLWVRQGFQSRWEYSYSVPKRKIWQGGGAGGTLIT